MDLADLTPLFEELASPVRSRLLQSVAVEPATVTVLSGMIRLSPQEVSRHLNRLATHHLVARDASRAYHATAFARAMLEELGDLEQLQRQRAFFQAHEFAMLPPELPVLPLACARRDEGTPEEARARLLAAVEQAEGPVRLLLPDFTLVGAALRRGHQAPMELIVPWTLAGSEDLLALGEAHGPGVARRTTVRLVERVPLLLCAAPQQTYALFHSSDGGALNLTCLVNDPGPAFRAWGEGVLAWARNQAVLAYDPAHHAPADWRRSIALAASGFLHRRRAPKRTRAVPSIVLP